MDEVGTQESPAYLSIQNRRVTQWLSDNDIDDLEEDNEEFEELAEECRTALQHIKAIIGSSISKEAGSFLVVSTTY